MLTYRSDMADVPDIPRPSQLWKQLTPERKAQAADAFWRDENGGVEQAEAIAAIAQRLKFRPKSVVALPIDKKVRYLTSMPVVSELLAARLLVAYHLQHQRPMMAAFLDAVGIRHEDGLIDDEEVRPPDPETLRKAGETLNASFAAEEVSLYFATLVWQDPDTWGALADLVTARQ